MRAASGRFGLGLGKSNKDQHPTQDNEHDSPGHNRVTSSGTAIGAAELAKSVKGRIAHTSMLPSIIGNQNLKELQTLITNEKTVLQNEEKLGSSIGLAANSLATWGATQGSDLSDVLGHAEAILQHLAQAFQTYASRQTEIRTLLKDIRTREEELEDLLKRRRQTGSRAEREEKKLAKMGQENKNLQSQTELLQSLRDQMRQMDTDILIGEAKLGDFKRRITKEALAIKFGGCFELAEKAQIVGELGKLLIEEIPLEETPPGYGRAPYEGFEQTQRLSAEADRVIKEVVYLKPVVTSLPPGLPHSRRLEPLQTPSTATLPHEAVEDYKRAAEQYGDDPNTHAYSSPPRSNVMFSLPDTPGFAPSQPNYYRQDSAYSSASYRNAEPAQPTVEERERAQAEADARETDTVYAADATIMPAKHVYPVHMTPAVTSLNHVNGATGPSLSRSLSEAQPVSREDRQTPAHHLVERGSTRTLTIGDWTIKTVKRPILNGVEIDAASEHLNIPLPEMTFGNNSLELVYKSSEYASTFTLSFDALQALAGVSKGDGWEDRVGGGVQVSMAEHWSQSRTQGTSYLSDIPISDKPTKPFDWTYSNTFSGEIDNSDIVFTLSETDSIPMDILARQDPVLDKILFYDDVSLFEDELHDNGESVMNVRIRVMPHSFFILSRLFLRVDNVLFRTHDVRIFHSFGTGKIIKEVMGRECTYNEVKGRLESQDDLSPLNDVNFVTQVMSSLTTPSTTLSGKLWPGLGVRKEILELENLPVVHQKASEGLTDIKQPMSPKVEHAPLSPERGNAQLTTAELQAQSKPRIMDRPRGVKRSDEAPGDGTYGGHNYGYDSNSYFVRNHASSPSQLPREEEMLPAFSSVATSSNPTSTEGDKFYTPVGTPGLNGPPQVPFHPGTGARTISASAFRRKKPSLTSNTVESDHQSQTQAQPAVEISHSHSHVQPEHETEVVASPVSIQHPQHDAQEQVQASTIAIADLNLGAEIPVHDPPSYSQGEVQVDEAASPVMHQARE